MQRTEGVGELVVAIGDYAFGIVVFCHLVVVPARHQCFFFDPTDLSNGEPSSPKKSVFFLKNMFFDFECRMASLPLLLGLAACKRRVSQFELVHDLEKGKIDDSIKIKCHQKRRGKRSPPASPALPARVPTCRGWTARGQHRASRSTHAAVGHNSIGQTM